MGDNNHPQMDWINLPDASIVQRGYHEIRKSGCRRALHTTQRNGILEDIICGVTEVKLVKEQQIYWVNFTWRELFQMCYLAEISIVSNF